MPLQLDLTQRVVNVQWGKQGSIFIVGSQWFELNTTSDIWTNEITKTDELTNWTNTYSSPAESGLFMPSQYPGAAACKFVDEDEHPMFVVGGLADSSQGAAMMLTSKDGLAWTPQTRALYGEVYLLTWNKEEGALYAGMWDLSELLDPFSDRNIYDIALRSADGLTWSEVGRTNDTSSDRVSPVMEFCSDKVTDNHGHKVPTGIFGYDEKNDILITPDPVTVTFGQTYSGDDFNGYGARLKIIRGPGNETPGTETKALPGGMAKVWAVAYAGGVWQAVGDVGSDIEASGVIATSVDDGSTWQVTLTDRIGSSFRCAAAHPVLKPSEP